MTADRLGTQGRRSVWVLPGDLVGGGCTRHVFWRQPDAEGAGSDASPAHMPAAPLRFYSLEFHAISKR